MSNQVPIISLVMSKIYRKDFLSVNIRDELATKHNNDVINRAKQYIKENYYKEDISLNSVASEVFLSPSHFSAVFAKNRTNLYQISY